MDYVIITNNPAVHELTEKKTGYDLYGIEGTVQEVLVKCEELFLQGNCHLAADPMGGRRARPFPYLTLILEKGRAASAADWERIADYSVLNEKRKAMYISNSDRLNEDFRVLDKSLTLTALKLY